MKLKLLRLILPIALLTVSMSVHADDYVAEGEIIRITQDVEASRLKLKNNQTLDHKATKTGYTLNEVNIVECTHTTDKTNGTVKCTPGAAPLKPTKNELKNNVVLTGKLKNKSYELNIESYNPGGENNIVSHYRLTADFNEAGIGSLVLAEPYVCPDTYAGYSYYEQHFSYCPNTQKFYRIGSSHTWLGCTKGEVGKNEFHYNDFSHTFSVYQFVPNQYTVVFKANGGEGAMESQTAVYDTSFNLNKNQFTREGYTFGGWSTKAGDIAKYSDKQSVKNLTDKKNGTVTLYARWIPKVYTVTLDHQLHKPVNPGTGTIYEKYTIGWYLDKECTKVLRDKNNTGKISIPEKNGYVFQGYYDSKTGGKQMIDADGLMTKAGIAEYKKSENSVWYAHYNYQVVCEDYADIPCDFRKADGDNREDVEVLIAYDKEAGQTIVTTGGMLQAVGKESAIEKESSAGQTGCVVTLSGKPAGTQVGQFQSVCAGKFTDNRLGDTDTVSQTLGNKDTASLSVTPREGAAYQLKVTAAEKVICDRTVYFENGRFRTYVKLGLKEGKEVSHGGSIAGSAWNGDILEYAFYQYSSCTEVKDVQAPDVVQRYFIYKDVNMAYSGNGATSGKNELEENISLENIYQFRKNPFAREEKKVRQTKDGQEYKCVVTYNFTGWQMIPDRLYYEQEQSQVSDIYNMAKRKEVISTGTIEDIRTYQKVEPIAVGGKSHNSSAKSEEKQNLRIGRQKGTESYAAEYINLLAEWNASPTIVVTPGDSLEFYEGEDVTKEDLISHLTSHDEEDNQKMEEKPDINDSIRIIKIAYPSSKNGSQTSYERNYEDDVPEDFLLDTYYLKLEEDEVVEALVTFAVTDRDGNTTEETFPVKVKYNQYPQINSEDIFYYLKEEANKGEITEETLIGRAAAEDTEDGDITEKLGLKDFDAQVIKLQTESKAKFTIVYQVTDAYKKTTYKPVELMILDEEAMMAEIPINYVRFISEEHLDTLEEHSAWREPENMAYLTSILRNETPAETWKFTHEDVIGIQNWIMEGGTGNWKIGQEANQSFLTEFASCRE